MKSKAFKSIFNFAFVLLTAYTAVLLYSRWVARDPRQGSKAIQFSAQSIDGTKLSLPLADGKPSVFVFWATWCGPCKVELDRMKQAAKDGEIPSDRIFAVSLGEPLETVASEANLRGYSFPVFADESNEASRAFKIRVTPTIMTVDKAGIINWVSEGIHPLTTKGVRKIFAD